MQQFCHVVGWYNLPPMTMYYDFEGKRMHCEVDWPDGAGSIQVQVTDRRLKDFPADLLFDIDRRNKIHYMVEEPSNRRLTNLQMILARRLQEFANQGTP